MAETNKIPETIAIRSPRAIAEVAEEFRPEIDRTYTKAAEALIADGRRYRAKQPVHRSRPRRLKAATATA